MKLIKIIINRLFNKKIYHPNVIVEIADESGKINFDEPISFSFKE